MIRRNCLVEGSYEWLLNGRLRREVMILKNFTFLLLDFLRKYINLVIGWWSSFFNIITNGTTSPVKVQTPLCPFF